MPTCTQYISTGIIAETNGVVISGSELTVLIIILDCWNSELYDIVEDNCVIIIIDKAVDVSTNNNHLFIIEGIVGFPVIIAGDYIIICEGIFDNSIIKGNY